MCTVVAFGNFVSFLFSHCFCFDMQLNGGEALPNQIMHDMHISYFHVPYHIGTIRFIIPSKVYIQKN